MWIDCRVLTDKDERTVELIDVTVSVAKFLDSSDEYMDKPSKFLEKKSPDLISAFY